MLCSGNLDNMSMTENLFDTGMIFLTKNIKLSV